MNTLHVFIDGFFFTFEKASKTYESVRIVGRDGKILAQHDYLSRLAFLNIPDELREFIDKSVTLEFVQKVKKIVSYSIETPSLNVNLPEVITVEQYNLLPESNVRNLYKPVEERAKEVLMSCEVPVVVHDRNMPTRDDYDRALIDSGVKLSSMREKIIKSQSDSQIVENFISGDVLNAPVPSTVSIGTITSLISSLINSYDDRLTIHAIAESNWSSDKSTLSVFFHASPWEVRKEERVKLKSNGHPYRDGRTMWVDKSPDVASRAFFVFAEIEAPDTMIPVCVNFKDYSTCRDMLKDAEAFVEMIIDQKTKGL